MAEVMETGLILSFDEIRLLLYSMGVRAVEGVYMPEKVFTEQEIIGALHHLSGRGLITAHDTAFFIREDLQKMLETVANPIQTMVWAPGSADEPGEDGAQEYFCYLVPGQVVVSERYWRKKDTLKLRLFTGEEFEKWKEQTAYDNRRG